MSAIGTTAVITAVMTLSMPAPVHAQGNVEGSLYGNVGAVSNGATVTALNTETGFVRTANVDSSGTFQVLGLKTGLYRVTLKVPGKPDQVAENINVSVGTGSSVSFAAPAAAGEGPIQMEKYSVRGAAMPTIDTSRVDSVTIINIENIEQVPVERNTTAVALLAPSTTQGVAAFGNLPSFGGASVAENAYYVNGFNLTNFRNGLGGGSVPFEFYDQFKVEEGGYSAEFGRSTGGVINATTKSGSNTFHAGANIYWEPGSLAQKSPTVIGSDGTVYIDHSHDWDNSINANVYASGPIIKNKLFYYAIYNERHSQHEDAQGVSTFYRSSSKDPFWGGKVDWNIVDGHTLSFTAISDKRRNNTDTLDYNATTGLISASHGKTWSDRGARDYIANYTGQFTPDLTVTALAGYSSGDATDHNSVPYVVDSRVSPSQILSGSSTLASTIKDTRRSYRVDVAYQFNAAGSHTLRVGYDREQTASDTLTAYAGGGIYYRYYNTAPGKVVNGGTVPAGVTQYVREQIYGNNGHFSTIADAYYIEDNWKTLNDRLLLSLGLRNDAFNNQNKLGQSFIKLKNQWGPRLGAAYDLTGDNKTKLFANYGRYFIPIAANTNIRFSGGEIYTQDYYALNGVDPTTKLPTVGAPIGNHYILPGEDGSIKDPTTIVNQDLKPQYQDEYILGVQHDFGAGFTAGVRGIFRDAGTFIEDIGVDLIPGDDSTYADILTNPGHTLNVWQDLGDGKGLRQFILQPNQQGYGGEIQPKAVRKYYAAEFSFEKRGEGNKWWVRGSYTWSHTYGNDEGWVLSDIGQTDAGLTELFDYPQIMNGRWGDLNNDRRHKIKAYGVYKLSSEFQLGANMLVQSGTPRIAIGYWPGADANLNAYGAAYFYRNGILVPRGSLGRLPWTYEFDLTLKYIPSWGHDRLIFGADVFNVLGGNNATELYSYAESGASGTPDKRFGTASVFQQPRYLRLSASYKF